MENRIKELRLARGWDQAALAEAMGVDIQAVSRLESGHRALDAGWLKRLSVAFNLPQGDFLKDDLVNT